MGWRYASPAIAKLKSGQILLVTVDGRQPGESIGMSLTMLADLLLEFGALDAINLDGGGSTTMVIKNKLVNKPFRRDRRTPGERRHSRLSTLECRSLTT